MNKDSDSTLGILPDLTPENIERVEMEVDNHPKYGKDGNGKQLDIYFTNKKNNSCFHEVLHKIMLIDYTNSTQLQRHKKELSIFTLADRITKMVDFDKRVKNGDLELVTELAWQQIEPNSEIIGSDRQKKEHDHINLFSFATKYCHYHNRITHGNDHYSIYDNVVAAVIPYYLKTVKPTSIKQMREKRLYKKYYQLITKIIYEYHLEQVPLIRYKLDHFLWFPNKLDFYTNGGKKIKAKIKQS
jgi:hypothetical protein